MKKVVGIVNLVIASTFAFGMDISKSVNIHKPREDQIRKVELTYQTETSSESKLLSDIIGNLESQPGDASKDFISVLEDKGLKAINHVDEHGDSLLTKAVSALNDELVRLLLRVPDIDLNLKDTYGYTAFQNLCNGAAMRSERTRYKVSNIMEMFIDDDRVDVCMLDSEGFSPLLTLIDCGYYDAAKLMLNLIKDKKGSDFLNKVVNQECRNSQTPLRLAVRNEEEDMVKTLLDHGASITGRSVENAIETENESIAKMLLDHGAILSDEQVDQLIKKSIAKMLQDYGAIPSDERVDQLIKRGSVSMLGFLLKYYMRR